MNDANYNAGHMKSDDQETIENDSAKGNLIFISNLILSGIGLFFILFSALHFIISNIIDSFSYIELPMIVIWLTPFSPWFGYAAFAIEFLHARNWDKRVTIIFGIFVSICLIWSSLILFYYYIPKSY